MSEPTIMDVSLKSIVSKSRENKNVNFWMLKSNHFIIQKE